MKRISKFFLFMLTFVLAIMGVEKVNAETYNGKIYDVYHPDSGFTVFAEESNGWMDYNSWMIKSSIDSRTYYCIDPAIALGEAPAGSFNYITNENSIIGNSNLTKTKYDKVRLLAYYGYGYKNGNVYHTSKKWYGITQVMIWRVMRPDLTWTFKASRNATPDKNLYASEVAEMNRLVVNHNKVASFDGKKLKLLIGESVTLTDTNNVLSNFFRVNALKYVDVKESGNKITITAKKQGSEAVNYSFRNGITNPIALLTSNIYQDVFVRGMPTDLAHFKFNVEVTGGTVNIQKVDGTTNKAEAQGDATLKGAVYEIYDENGKSVGKITTDNRGQGKISLDYGKYTIKEIKAPEGYHLSNQVYEFEITKDNSDINLEVKDKVITGKVLLTKKKGGAGEDFTAEADATFDILNSKEEVVEKLTTNEKGISIAVLPYGTYTIHQTGGADGYVFNEDITLNLTENKIYEFDIKNLKLSKLVFTKTDISSGKPLPNTKIEIYKENDELIFSGITDNKGQIEVPNLEIGKYYILEKEAPKYYRLNEEKMEFEVKENGQVIKANMQDERKEGNLIFTKTDVTGKKLLSNAFIEIYFAETNEKVFSGKTDSKDMIKIEGLIAGKYYILEKKAPDGYQLLEKPIYFEILEENETVKVNMTNKEKEKIKIPDTKDNKDLISNIISVSVILIGFGIIVIYEKKKH